MSCIFYIQLVFISIFTQELDDSDDHIWCSISKSDYFCNVRATTHCLKLNVLQPRYFSYVSLLDRETSWVSISHGVPAEDSS